MNRKYSRPATKGGGRDRSTTLLSVSFAAGWDRRNRWTLQFLDPELERAFQDATLEPFRHRWSLAVILVIPVWVMVVAST